MILEGLVTTTDRDDSCRLTPMGAEVDRQLTRLNFRPFVDSRTFGNWQRTLQGIFHVTDDVELIARAAINQLEETPHYLSAQPIHGHILATACRWYAFQIVQISQDRPRAHVQCEIIARGRLRDFFGLNRAMHAVIEAAILATRVSFLSADRLEVEMQRLAPLVEKTGGARERRAFALLQQFIDHS